VLINRKPHRAGGRRGRAIELPSRRTAFDEDRSRSTNQSHLREAIAAGADVIKLDCMSMDEIRESRVDQSEAPAVIIEGSGGVTLENVSELQRLEWTDIS